MVYINLSHSGKVDFEKIGRKRSPTLYNALFALNFNANEVLKVTNDNKLKFFCLRSKLVKL